jgi:hypothetical protein
MKAFLLASFVIYTWTALGLFLHARDEGYPEGDRFRSTILCVVHTGLAVWCSYLRWFV